MLECHIEKGLSMMMKEEDKCEPWYYPPVDPKVRLCSPFEAWTFQKVIDAMPSDVCQVSK